NFTHDIALHDLIISLYADESLSPELSEYILKIKKRDAINIYSFNRLSNYCGKWIRHGGWYPDIKIRMYDRRRGKWEGSIHERLLYPENEKVIRLEGDCF